APKGVTALDGRLYVVDAGNNRIMVWKRIPDSHNAPADFFIGQSGPGQGKPNAGGATPNAAGLNFPTEMVIAHGSLFVSDTGNRRVLVFTPVPSDSGPTASAILGQDIFEAGDLAPNPAANRMNTPQGLTVMGNKLFVVDMIWDR